MNFDTFRDRLESKRVRYSALVLCLALLAWWEWRRSSPERQAGEVCSSLYRGAHSTADTAAIDTSRTLVRGRNHVAVLWASCGELRRAEKLE